MCTPERAYSCDKGTKSVPLGHVRISEYSEGTYPVKDLSCPFSFAVVSDTHFVRREFVDSPTRSTNPLDAETYLENVTFALAPMMDALRKVGPDFLVITGDIVEPGEEGDLTENLKAALGFFSACEIPIIYVRGNLDEVAAFDSVVRPKIGATLSTTLTCNHFSFEVDGCLFLVLDTAAWSDDQCKWVEGQLKSAQMTSRHIFVLGHHPIWPVARAFFTPYAFHNDMVGLLDTYSIDAYFCGHTHNQSIIWHRTKGLPVLQFMGAMIGLSDEPPMVLNQILSFLPEDDDLLAFWPGYLENTAPGWFMVSVKSEEVVAEWHHLNRGSEAVVAWERPGDLIDFWMMDQVPPSKLIPTDLGRIRRAFLRFCAWDGVPGMGISLNGTPVGDLPVSDGFAPTRFELPGHILRTLQKENRLRVSQVPNCESTIGNLMLEVMLPGGRYIRTPATGELFSWTDKWSTWANRKLKKLKPGEDLQSMLVFG